MKTNLLKKYRDELKKGKYIGPLEFVAKEEPDEWVKERAWRPNDDGKWDYVISSKNQSQWDQMGRIITNPSPIAFMIAFALEEEDVIYLFYGEDTLFDSDLKQYTKQLIGKIDKLLKEPYKLDIWFHLAENHTLIQTDDGSIKLYHNATKEEKYKFFKDNPVYSKYYK